MGSIRIAGRWRTTATEDRLWQVVVDLSSWSRWWPAIQDARPLEGPHGEPDTARLVFDTPAGLRPLAVVLTVTERETPNRLVVELTDGPLRGHGTIIVSGDGAAGTVTYSVELGVRSLVFKPIERVLSGATRSGGRERLARAGEDLARLAGGELLDHIAT